MNKWILGAFFACSLLTSCSKDKDDDAPQSNGSTDGRGAEVKFSSNVVADNVVVVGRSATTRAPLDKFGENAQVGVLGIPAIQGGNNQHCNLRDCKTESDFQPYLFNGKYTYVSGYDNLQSEFQATYPSNANPALYLYAYYPYTAELDYRSVGESSAQWAVKWKLEKTDMSKTIDYLYTGEKNVLYSEQGVVPIVLNFNHAFGRLDFSFYSKEASVIALNYVVKSVSVTCYSGDEGWMAITDGKLSFTTNEFTCKYPVVNGTLGVNSPSAVAAQFLLPPDQTIIKEVTCKVLSGAGIEKDYIVYQLNAYQPVPVKKGQITTMRVNFAPKDASMSSSIKIESWVKGTIMDVNVKLQ